MPYSAVPDPWYSSDPTTCAPGCCSKTIIFIQVLLTVTLGYWVGVYSADDYLIAAMLTSIGASVILSIVIFNSCHLYFVTRARKGYEIVAKITNKSHWSHRQDCQYEGKYHEYYVDYKFTIDASHLTIPLTQKLAHKVMEDNAYKLPKEIIDLYLEFLGYDDLKFNYGPYKYHNSVRDEVYHAGYAIEIQCDTSNPNNHYICMEAGIILWQLYWFMALSIVAFGFIIWIIVDFFLNYMHGSDTDEYAIAISILLSFIAIFGSLTSRCVYKGRSKGKLDHSDLTVISEYYKGCSAI